jgi:hypothetical protein
VLKGFRTGISSIEIDRAIGEGNSSYENGGVPIEHLPISEENGPS